MFDLHRFGHEAARALKPGGVFFATLYPGESKGGNDAWTARQAASLDNKGGFVQAMRDCGFTVVAEATVEEDMDLTAVMPPGARTGIWHQIIHTVYLRRNEAA